MKRQCKLCPREIRRKDNVSGYCTGCQGIKYCLKCKRRIRDCMKTKCKSHDTLLILEQIQSHLFWKPKQYNVNEKIAWNIYNFIEIQKDEGWVTYIDWQRQTKTSRRTWEKVIKEIKELFFVEKREMNQHGLMGYKIKL